MRNPIWFMKNGRGTDAEPAPAPRVAHALSALDPEREDPSYWFRFRNAVALRATAELARRRRVELTVGDLVLSWSRAVVPATMLAAAAAGFLLLLPGPVTSVSPSIEEILSEGLPGALEDDPGGLDVEVSFASESF